MAEKRNSIWVDAPWLLITTGVAVTITAWRFLVQVRLGPGWDPYTFLLNALEYAGLGKDYMEIYRPPVLPFFVSLFNRAGIVEEWPLFFVDGAFAVLGVIGLYLLLRERMSGPLSMLGSLAFLTFPDVVENLAIGVTDVMSVAVSIWLVLFVVRALRTDARYMRWAILLVPVAFMTRFTGGMMLAVIIFALVTDTRAGRYTREIVFGVLYSAVLLVPYAAYHWWRFGDPLIQIWEPFRAVTATERVGMLAGAIEPPTYFLTGAPAALSASPVAWGLLLLLIVGIALLVQDVVDRRAKQVSRAKGITLGVSLAALTVLIVGPTSFLPVLVGWVFVLGLLVPRWVLADDDFDTRMLLVIAFWFVMYLAVHSHMLVKVTRYYITMMPAATFLMAYAIQRGIERISDSEFEHDRARRWAVTGATVAVGLVALSFSLQGSIERLDSLQLEDFEGYEDTRAWMDSNVENSTDVMIASDVYPALRYHLERRIYPMPPFQVDHIRKMEDWLDTYEMEYFVTVHGYPEMKRFEPVFTSGDVTIYERREAPSDIPRVLLVGKSVDRHLVEVLDTQDIRVEANLNVIPDDYSSTDGTYIDDHTVDELLEYDAVLLYGFRWHDRLDAEELVAEYARRGGTVLVDATQNLGGLPSNFNGIEDTTFLNVLVQRGSLAEDGAVTVLQPELVHGTASPEFGPFVSESGGTWYTAVYSPLENVMLRPLVTYGGSTLVQEQTIGEGRILWMSGNLGFHAYLRGTAAEKQLLQDLFEYATQKADASGDVAARPAKED
jgi:hypothetical protein